MIEREPESLAQPLCGGGDLLVHRLNDRSALPADQELPGVWVVGMFARDE